MSSRWKYICDHIAKEFTTKPPDLLLDHLAATLKQDKTTLAGRFSRIDDKLELSDNWTAFYGSSDNYKKMQVHGVGERGKRYEWHDMRGLISTGNKIYKAVRRPKWEWICDHLATHLFTRPPSTLISDLIEKGHLHVSEENLYRRFQGYLEHSSAIEYDYDNGSETKKVKINQYTRKHAWTWEDIERYVEQAKRSYEHYRSMAS